MPDVVLNTRNTEIVKAQHSSYIQGVFSFDGRSRHINSAAYRTWRLVSWG